MSGAATAEADADVLVRATGIGKRYKVFDSPADRLKEALHPFGRSYHREFHALRDVSFEVRRGEALAIVGRNGSGKSTLLKLITGIFAPTSGELLVRGRIAALLELGAGFNPEYTGVENVYLNGTFHGLSRAEVDDRLESILAFADIGDFAFRACKSYSSGMFARLAFAAMIHFEPDILIVDEALAVGDVFFQQKCNRWMKEHMGGVTKLLVTHDMNSVAQMASRAILLERGEVVCDGEPIDVIERYTKSLHTELFSSDAGQESPRAGTADDRGAQSSAALAWNLVSGDATGGAGEVRIVRWRASVRDAALDIVRPGDLVHLVIEVEAARAVRSVVVGVAVSDKYGQTIFGVNSLGSGHRSVAVACAGTHEISVEFAWPEVKAETYFLTLGIGEGDDELNHVVQCWAHNVHAVQAIASRPMHGIFNVPMRSVSVR